LVRPCLRKIDVQGYELDVLNGAGAVLDSVDQILVECSFTELYLGQRLAGDIVCHLLERDFEFAGLYNPAYDRTQSPKHLLQADLLFSKAPLRSDQSERVDSGGTYSTAVRQASDRIFTRPPGGHG